MISNDELREALDLKTYIEIIQAVEWCDQYMLSAINAQIKSSKNKNDKAIQLINKINCAKKNVDINLIDVEITGNELKQIARKCANMCFSLKNKFSNDEKVNTFLKDTYSIDDLLKDFYLKNNQAKLGVTLPAINFKSHLDDSKLIKRLVTTKFWNKKLRDTIKRNRYLIFCHIGAVGKNMNKYAPIDAIENFKKQLLAQEHFVKNNVLFNEKTGEVIDLKDIVSTPEKRFNQMYTLIKGIDKYATDKKMVSAMITLTAPAKYHCNPQHGKNTWELSDYATQKEAQNWIAEKWNLVTMRLNKLQVEKIGLRISEAHTDGTPHWHALIYFNDGYDNVIKNAIASVWNMKNRKGKEKYQINITKKMVTKNGIVKKGNEKLIGSTAHVLNEFSNEANWIDIDKAKGTAASYVCKYIAKTCLYDAKNKSKFAQDLEVDSFENEKNNFLGVAATRSIWNIRAFQFFGLPQGSVGLWVMYRRQRNEILLDKLEIKRRDVACEGDFCSFIKLIKTNTPKIFYNDKINSFGEITKKAIGYIVKNKIYEVIKNEFIIVTKTNKFCIILESMIIVRVINNDPSKMQDQELSIHTISINFENVKENNVIIQDYNALDPVDFLILTED